MKPGLKYALGRLGIFVACAVPLFLLLPRDLNPFLILAIAFVASAALSYFLLRQWREEVTQAMSSNAGRRVAEKERLRSALAGDDDYAEHGADDRG